MNSRTARSWMKKIEAQRVAIGKRRDALREMISELESLEETCSRACDDLEAAVSALSEFA